MFLLAGIGEILVKKKLHWTVVFLDIYVPNLLTSSSVFTYLLSWGVGSTVANCLAQYVPKTIKMKQEIRCDSCTKLIITSWVILQSVSCLNYESFMREYANILTSVVS